MQPKAAPGHDSLAPLAYSPAKAYSAFAYGTNLRAVLPKRNTFGKEKGGKKTKLVQKAAFPSLPSPYGFPPPFAAF